MKSLYKILVVDDDKVSFQIILKYFSKLEEKEFELISATNGKTTLKILSKKKIDLVLLDWIMPMSELSGIDVLEKMQSNPDTKDIPVLMITGRIKNKDLEFALEKGVHDYLKKPINRVELIARTKSALRIFDDLKEIKEQKRMLQQTHKNLLKTYQKIEFSEKKLSEMNKVKNKLFSVISHDLKSPLNSLQMLLKMLLDKIDFLTKEEIRELMGKIDIKLDDTQLLMTNLLKWAKNQMSSLKMVYEHIELKEIVSENITSFKEHIKRKKLKVVVHLKNEEEIRVQSSKDMLNFIIGNLLHNIIKNAKHSSTIDINSIVYKDKFEISIMGNNVDLDINEQKEIFKLTTYTSDKGFINRRGIGLGLVLCKEFIEKNQGNIKIESRKANAPTFSFSLPTLAFKVKR